MTSCVAESKDAVDIPSLASFSSHPLAPSTLLLHLGFLNLLPHISLCGSHACYWGWGTIRYAFFLRRCLLIRYVLSVPASHFLFSFFNRLTSTQNHHDTLPLLHDMSSLPPLSLLPQGLFFPLRFPKIIHPRPIDGYGLSTKWY